MCHRVVASRHMPHGPPGVANSARERAVHRGVGFQFFDAASNKPIVTDLTKQCFECHQPQKNQDYVFSTYIP